MGGKAALGMAGLAVLALGGISFAEEVKDVEGNVYTPVKIGAQVWLKENLQATKYRNGEPIATTAPLTQDLSKDGAVKYQWPAQGTDSAGAVYGRLYTFAAATDERKVCPAGWEVPTEAEWTAMVDYLGTADAGTKLKEEGQTRWPAGNNTGDNASGFTAIQSGVREPNGTFFGGDAGFWTSTPFATIYARYVRLYSYKTTANITGSPTNYGYSVRCLQSAAVGIREGASSESIKQVRLAADGRYRLELPSGASTAIRIRVTDIRGAVLPAVVSGGNGSREIDLSSAPQGLYFLEASEGGAVLGRSILVR